MVVSRGKSSRTEPLGRSWGRLSVDGNHRTETNAQNEISKSLINSQGTREGKREGLNRSPGREGNRKGRGGEGREGKGREGNRKGTGREE